MPRIPDYTALPDRPPFRTGRTVAPGPDDLVGPAVRGLGASIVGTADKTSLLIGDMAKADTARRAAEQEQAQKDRRATAILQGSSADAAFSKGLGDLTRSLDDGDHGTHGARFDAGSNALIAKHAATITDPNIRVLWVANARHRTGKERVTVTRRADAGQQQSRITQLDTTLGAYGGIIADPAASEENWAQAYASLGAAIDQGEKAGIYSPDLARSRRETYLQVGAFARGKRMNSRRADNPIHGKLPQQPTTPQQTAADAPSFPLSPQNDLSPVLLARDQQQGVPAAPFSRAARDESEGPAAPSPAAPQAAADAPSFPLPPRNNLSPLLPTRDQQQGAPVGAPSRSAEIESGGPVVPVEGAARDTAANKQALRLALGRGPTAAELQLAQQRGPTGAAKLLASPDATAASLIGTKAVIQNDGRQDMPARDFTNMQIGRVDGTATPAAIKDEASAERTPDDYTKAYQFFQTKFPKLDPVRVSQLAQDAVVQKATFAVEDRLKIERAVEDADAALQSTGTYTGYMPTPEDFRTAYGDSEGKRRSDAFQAGIEAGKAAYDFPRLSDSEIRARVADARPPQTGDGAAIAAAKYAALAAAADSQFKLRREDPAGAVVQAFPIVRQAWQEASQSPEKFAAALRASAAAQTQLGIAPDRQRPVPKESAANVVAAAKDETRTPAERLGALKALIMATSDRGQRQAIVKQLADAGLPGPMDGVLEAAAAGRNDAAGRLFAAANLKAGDLPGKLPHTDEAIDQAIEDGVMADGEVGDLLYGLKAGNRDNLRHAANDAPLLKNGVKLYLTQNFTLKDAVRRAAQDLYGDLIPVLSGQVKAAVPADADPSQIIDGLGLKKGAVREQILQFDPHIDGDMASDRQQRDFGNRDKRRYADAILDSGQWRNVGGGFGFWIPEQGKFIGGKDGKPFVVTQDEAVAAATEAVQPPKAAADAVNVPVAPADDRPTPQLSPAEYQVRRRRRSALEQLQRDTAAIPVQPPAWDQAPANPPPPRPPGPSFGEWVKADGQTLRQNIRRMQRNPAPDIPE